MVLEGLFLVGELTSLNARLSDIYLLFSRWVKALVRGTYSAGRSH
jgi:hypothetical protein